MAKIETDNQIKERTAFEKITTAVIRDALNHLGTDNGKYILTIKVDGMFSFFKVTTDPSCDYYTPSNLFEHVTNVIKPFTMGFNVFGKYNDDDGSTVFMVQRFEIKREQMTLNYYAPSPLKAQ